MSAPTVSRRIHDQDEARHRQLLARNTRLHQENAALREQAARDAATIRQLERDLMTARQAAMRGDD